MHTRTMPTLLVATMLAIGAGRPALLWAADCLGLIEFTPVPAAPGPVAGIGVHDVLGGPCLGGFDEGDRFAPGGEPGQIDKGIVGDSALTSWVTLPAATSVTVVAIHQDRACVFDGDLLVVASNELAGVDAAGDLWRVSADGAATLIATLAGRVHAVVTVPSDAAKYGPISGRALVAAEDHLLAVAPGGDIVTVGAVAGTHPHYATSTAIRPGDVDLVPQAQAGIVGDGDFLGEDVSNARLLTAAASGFACRCGDVLVTQSVPDTGTSGVAILRWNGTAFDVESAPGTGGATQWGRVTFRGGGDCRTCSGVIGNYLWKDLDRDGLRDEGEPAIVDATVVLTRPDVPAFRTTVTTDAGGAYRFTGLCAGGYVVTVPDSAALTAALAGSDRSIDSNVNGTQVALATDGDSDLTIGFGFK